MFDSRNNDWNEFDSDIDPDVFGRYSRYMLGDILSMLCGGQSGSAAGCGSALSASIAAALTANLAHRLSDEGDLLDDNTGLSDVCCKSEDALIRLVRLAQDEHDFTSAIEEASTVGSRERITKDLVYKYLEIAEESAKVLNLAGGILRRADLATNAEAASATLLAASALKSACITAARAMRPVGDSEFRSESQRVIKRYLHVASNARTAVLGSA